MAGKTLQDKINSIGNPVDMLRNAPVGPYIFPVASEFSNWRDEQEAWRKSVALLDQSYHMTDLYVEGKDTVRLLSDLGVNSFKGFGRNKAKQLVVCNHDGYVIGDAVLFGLEDDRVQIVGRPPTENWVEFHARSGKYDVKVERDERTLQNSGQRKTYRLQVQGPLAPQVLEKLNGGPLPEIKFFNMGEIKIRGRTVRALRHGMPGSPGLEIWGPHEDKEWVREAIMEAGAEFGIRAVGARAYSTVAMESGWLPSPMPAIYTGDKLQSYRNWLSATSFEASASLGGSYYSNNIEDYYLTPWDIGYGHLVKFDHDFIGREALEKMKDAPHRHKVTLSWNSDDVIKVFATYFKASDRAKYLDMPGSQYSTLPYDMIMSNGKMVGISTYPVYTANGRCWISLSMVDDAHAATGTEVSVIWGEKDGGSKKPTVERHVQTEIRAVVGPSPYADSARENYRPYVLRT